MNSVLPAKIILNVAIPNGGSFYLSYQAGSESQNDSAENRGWSDP